MSEQPRLITDRITPRTEHEAMRYLASCQLSTVSSMAMKKSRGKYEYERQISIAQSHVDFLKMFGVKVRVDSRAYKVLSYYDGDVSKWVKQYEE